MTKEIVLTQGKAALVDDEDYERLNQHKWRAAHNGGGNYYACRQTGTGVRQKQVYMHREILDAPDGMEVDHRNGDGLDNQRSNLRLATISQNRRNAKRHTRNKSGYKGVIWREDIGKWCVKIQVNKEQITVGYFNDLEEAARAYDAAAKELHGEFAKTNF